MKLEIKFEIVEVTRYKIVRSNSFDNREGAGLKFQTGGDFGGNYGEFEYRHNAEMVKDALEASLATRIMSSV